MCVVPASQKKYDFSDFLVFVLRSAGRAARPMHPPMLLLALLPAIVGLVAGTMAHLAVACDGTVGAHAARCEEMRRDLDGLRDICLKDTQAAARIHRVGVAADDPKRAVGVAAHFAHPLEVDIGPDLEGVLDEATLKSKTPSPHPPLDCRLKP